MISPDAPSMSAVPGVARTSISAPLIMRQTSTANVVETGRSSTKRKPLKRAAR